MVVHTYTHTYASGGIRPLFPGFVLLFFLCVCVGVALGDVHACVCVSRVWCVLGLPLVYVGSFFLGILV